LTGSTRADRCNRWLCKVSQNPWQDDSRTGGALIGRGAVMAVGTMHLHGESALAVLFCPPTASCYSKQGLVWVGENMSSGCEHFVVGMEPVTSRPVCGRNPPSVVSLQGHGHSHPPASFLNVSCPGATRTPTRRGRRRRSRGFHAVGQAQGQGHADHGTRAS
jgi:hypothetical protein